MERENHLTDRQRLFVSYYLASPNATQAAIAAGYSKRTAYSQGQRLLKNVEIATRIAQQTSRVAMAADEVLVELSVIARGDYKEYRRDKVRALGLLGRFYGLGVIGSSDPASFDRKVDEAIGLVKWGVSLANCAETKAAHARGTNISLEFALSTLSLYSSNPEEVKIIREMERKLLTGE